MAENLDSLLQNCLKSVRREEGQEANVVLHVDMGKVIEGIRAELRELYSQSEYLPRDLHFIHEVIRQLSERIQFLNKGIQALSEEIKVEDQRMQSLMKEMEGINKRKLSLEKQLKRLESANPFFRSSQKSRNSDLYMTKSSLSETIGAAGKLKFEMMCCKQKIDTSQHEINSCQTQIESKQREIELRRIAIDRVNRLIAENEATLEKLLEKILDKT